MNTLNSQVDQISAIAFDEQSTSDVSGVDRLTDIAVDAGFDCTYVQLEPGSLSVHTKAIKAGRVGLVREEVDKSLEYRGTVNSENLTILFVISGENTRISGVRFTPDSLWIVPNQFELSMVTGGYIDVVTISVPRELIETEVPSNSPAFPTLTLETPVALRMTEKDKSEFTSTVRACFEAHANFEIGYELECLVVQNLATVIKKNRANRGVDNEREYKRHLRLMQASDHISRNLHRPVPISELSEATAMSDRTLLRHFKAHFGLSPNQYARVRRLEEVRRTLALQPARPGLVTDSALSFGFTHLGHFAAEFENHFGVLPSDLLTKLTAEPR